MQILAIDPATVFGYCYGPEIVATGFHNLGPAKESKGRRLLDFYAHLERLLKESNAEMIAYERPAGGHFTGVQFHCNLEAIILVLAELNNIKAVPISSKSVKKFITGNGNAKKPEMVAEIKKTYPHVKDHNEADAIGIYHFAQETIKNV
jgi:Holliday junction resolvasome RuvABC endonuclease subunit